jgi:hypothetical protein
MKAMKYSPSLKSRVKLGRIAMAKAQALAIALERPKAYNISL